MKYDFKYIFLNRFICTIPSWHIRSFFYKLFGMKIGKGSRIGIGTIVIEPRGIVIGDRTIVNENCHLDGRGKLSIGNDVSISIYSKIITASHVSSSEKFTYYEAPVKIGNNVWLGCGAVILDGSNIEDKCVIGAGCVIKGNTNTNMVYVGNPAKAIKQRNIKGEYEISYHPYFR